MKHLLNITLAVAGLTFAAGSVSAQPTLKAEIPFAFHVGKSLMQPGEYQVRPLASAGGTHAFVLTNYDRNRSAIVPHATQTSPSKQWASSASPKLSFRCIDGYCELAQLWTGQGDVYNMPLHVTKHGEAQITDIALRTNRTAD